MSDFNDKGIIQKSRLIVNEPWFSLYQHKIQTPDEQIIDRYLVHRPEAVAIVAIHDNRILITKEYRVGLNKITYGIPAGQRNGLESPEVTALRELEEETGVKIKMATVKDLITIATSEGFTDEKVHIVRVMIDKFEETNTNFDEGEYIESDWLDIQSAKNLVTSGKIMGAASVLGILQYTD